MNSNNEGPRDLMSEIFREYERDEAGLKSNPGYGKPLPKKLFTGNVYDNFVNTAKNAGYLPPWVKLQQEIRDLLQEAVEQDKADVLLAGINEKIRKYNSQCPVSMQRGLIEKNTIRTQMKSWL
ncbi:DUF1992 domain-containing protein [Actinomycetes bacterium NPDC127524]|uniref:DUF1992 domain-containing protein n=1 Tax=Bacillus sp. OV322 TaxID=1882764 RepID=UPI0008ED6FD4|nr:DUF1992 domain-containing protein [Bacillus sp. OV322]SFC20064.1 protein of unknown function [Bacillus sp. OV322]